MSTRRKKTVHGCTLTLPFLGRNLFFSTMITAAEKRIEPSSYAFLALCVLGRIEQRVADASESYLGARSPSYSGFGSLPAVRKEVPFGGVRGAYSE